MRRSQFLRNFIVTLLVLFGVMTSGLLLVMAALLGFANEPLRQFAEHTIRLALTTTNSYGDELWLIAKGVGFCATIITGAFWFYVRWHYREARVPELIKEYIEQDFDELQLARPALLAVTRSRASDPDFIGADIKDSSFQRLRAMLRAPGNAGNARTIANSLATVDTEHKNFENLELHARQLRTTALLVRAQYWIAAKQDERAIEALRNALAVTEDVIEALDMSATIMRRAKDSDQEIGYLKRMHKASKAAGRPLDQTNH